MKYTIEELLEMIYALHDAIDELELNLNTTDDQPSSRQAYTEQLTQLSKITKLLTDLKDNGTLSN
jgi:hypothetical protein